MSKPHLWTVLSEVITRNSIKCLDCGDEIESTHVHDFRACGCGAVMVDGGRDYRRRGWDGTKAGYEDTSIYETYEVSYEDLTEVSRVKVDNP